MSILQAIIIPTMVQSYANQSGSHFKKFLREINSTLTFLNAKHFELYDLATNISDFLPISDGSKILPFYETFAFIDDEKTVSLLSELIKVQGTRLVVRNRENKTPFLIPNMIYTNTNFFAPTMHRFYSNLRQSGISGRWEKLSGLWKLLISINVTSREEFKVVFAKKMGESGGQVEIHGANAISLKVAKYMLALCAGGGLVGVVRFMIELNNSCLPVCRQIWRHEFS